MASEVIYAVRCHRCAHVNEIVPVRQTDKKELACEQCGTKLPYPFTKYRPYSWRREYVSLKTN